MNSRFCYWLIFPAMMFCASGAWAQCSSPVSGQENIAALKQQAASGNAEAQCGLGIMYESGTGVPQDFAQAAIWYRKAAEQGDSDAQYNLGRAYALGEGVLQDYAQAVVWTLKAAEQGDSDAQYSLGFAYDVGQGVPSDPAQAALWYRKAADQGNASAQYTLGMLYNSGRGVPRDFAESYFWSCLAAAGNVQGIKPEDAAHFRDLAAAFSDQVSSIANAGTGTEMV